MENGLGYDSFLDLLISASPRSDRKVIDVQTLLGLPDGVNPHVWYDPSTMPKVARAVADALEALRPASKSTVEANLETYLDSFAPLTAKIAELKARYPATPVAYTEPVPALPAHRPRLPGADAGGLRQAIERRNGPGPVRRGRAAATC